MAICTTSCDTELNLHDLVQCDEYILGGQPKIIVGLCGATLANPSSGSEIQALINAGLAREINDVRFAIPAGSPILIDSPIACQSQIRINEDRTATIFDGNYTNNNTEFWNALNKRNIAWIVVFSCNSENIIYINPPKPIRVSAQFIAPEQDNEIIRYEVTFSWRDKDIPLSYPAPVL
jgi:hypothetical protein